MKEGKGDQVGKSEGSDKRERFSSKPPYTSEEGKSMTDSERKALDSTIARLKSEKSDLAYKYARMVEQNIQLINQLERISARTVK